MNVTSHLCAAHLVEIKIVKRFKEAKQRMNYQNKQYLQPATFATLPILPVTIIVTNAATYQLLHTSSK